MPPYPIADTGSVIIFAFVLFLMAVFLEYDERKKEKVTTPQNSRLKILYTAFGVLLAVLFFIIGTIPQSDIRIYEM